MCHNYYQRWGGEDQCFEDEARLLEDHGHEVVRYTMHNDSVKDQSRIGVACRTLWNRTSYGELRTLLQKVRPDLIHFTNTFPLISPSAYYAARAERIPILHALHDFRLLCPQGHFLRDHAICESCLTKTVKLPCIANRCYRGSVAGSTVVASMIATHWYRGTWNRVIDRYYCPSNFTRSKYIEGGFPAERIAVKPNFVYPDPGVGGGRGGYAIFAARLSPEKGLRTILDAWSRLRNPIPLKIAGDGPEGHLARDYAKAHPHVEWLGFIPLKELMPLISEASVMIVPSTWYETFGRTIIEAFATGTPVIATRMGAMAELIDEGRTGYLFNRADGADLARCVEELLSDPQRLQKIRVAARAEYERNYTPAANYRFFEQLFEETFAAARSRRSLARGDGPDPALSPRPAPANATCEAL
jgi:glycosyltransferase involved in cell wall biosynthesis